MISINPGEIFESRLRETNEVLQKTQKSSLTVASIRFILFVLFLAGAIYFFNQREATQASVSLTLMLTSFFLIVPFHNRLKEKIRVLRNIASINKRELKIFGHNLLDLDGGGEFIDPEHPFTSDLDVFGKGSLFCQLNRSGTNQGRSKLAEWLRFPLKLENITARQKAVEELKPKLEWRQEFEAQKSSILEVDSSLREWLHIPSIRQVTWFKSLTFIVPTITIGIIVLFSLGLTDLKALALPFVLGLLALRKISEQVDEIHKQAKHHIRSLDSISKQLQMLEQYEASFDFLRSKCMDLKVSDASGQIRKLHKILDTLNGRANIFYWFFNVFFLIDIHLVGLFNRWKSRNMNSIALWLDHLGEIDAICSIAGFAFTNPEFPFPQVTKETESRGVEIGHPLIHRSKRVSNDFSISGKGAIALITGSNMSGKSTFLRGLGLNSLLAYIGAPVCARSLRLGRFKIYTSMRVVDNLDQNMSSFYAELARIKALVETLEGEETVFYLLDEILLGTNSNDRHAGSVALIKQLTSAKALGLIATHDLKLGELEGDIPQLTNYCFTSEVKGDEILFDYKIRGGIGYNFNATELMKKMGLKL